VEEERGEISLTARESLGDFEDILGKSIDETLTSLFSREVVEALYTHLKQFHNLPKEQVPHKLETLCFTLDRTFGQPTSRTIGKAIAKRLYAKLELNFPKHNNPSLTILDYVEEAKIKLSQSNRQG
jgi:hypothetical protein